MNYYLDDFAKEYSHYRIILCSDNAGWHVSSGLNIPENIVFLYLPPYSPQLNPVEHLWDYIREQKNFNNRIFNNIEEVIDTLSDVLHEIGNEKEIIKSMCNFNWLY
jgi:transposase